MDSIHNPSLNYVFIMKQKFWFCYEASFKCFLFTEVNKKHFYPEVAGFLNKTLLFK